MEARTDVAVVGAGSTGASVLYHLAEAATDCLLIDQGEQIASGQTSRSTALVRTHYTVETVARMALLSYNFFRDFEKNLPGRSAGYVETGLLIGVDPKSEKAVKDNMEMLRSLGAITDLVDRDEAKRLEPFLDPSPFAALVFEPHAGYAEPSATASAFVSAAKEHRAKTMMGVRVTKIARSGSGYRLDTTGGGVVARKVVLATGPWSKPIFASLGIGLPMKAVRHPVAIYRRPPEYPGTRPVIFDLVNAGYYKPEGIQSLIVGSLELELDISGAEVDPDGYRTDITSEEMTKLSGWVMGALPVMAARGVYERGYAGVYDNTPDEQPVIDELSDYGFENLFCLVGLSGHGFKLAPEFGRIMAALVKEGAFKDYDVSPFRLRRFAEGKLLKSRYGFGTIG
jgi:glycine/D-amino acid oxidase-like deaminating enzyme